LLYRDSYYGPVLGACSQWLGLDALSKLLQESYETSCAKDFAWLPRLAFSEESSVKRFH
jgi:hypothetical protein